jgi:hypothetical protein
MGVGLLSPADVRCRSRTVAHVTPVGGPTQLHAGCGWHREALPHISITPVPGPSWPPKRMSPCREFGAPVRVWLAHSQGGSAAPFTMQSAHLPPLVVTLDGSDDPGDAIDALALGPLVAGVSRSRGRSD